MTATKENLGSNKVRLSVSVPAGRFQESIDKVYRNSRGEFTIPGFRKGKAPRAVIESHYGPATFYSRAFDDLFPVVYSEAVNEAEIVPVGLPENLVMKEMDGRKGIRFTVDVYTVPEVKLGRYEGLQATRLLHKVSEEDIDRQVRAVQLENSRWVESEAPAAAGDRVNIDFVGSIDGVPFEGGSADSTDLLLGSGTFIPGFEEQLEGIRAGEDRDIQVTFPEQYPAEDLAGREAVFAVHANSVKQRELPEADDDFAEDVSEYDTMEEWRCQIRERLQKQVDEELENALETELLSQVLADTEIDVPPVMIESEVNDRLSQARQELLAQGIALESYLAARNMDLPGYAATLAPDAERAIRLRLLMSELVRALDAQPTDEELAAAYDEMAVERRQDPEEFRKKMTKPQQDAIASREATRKMLAKLKDLSEITEKDLEEAAEEKAAAEEKPEAAAAEEKTDAAAAEEPQQENTEAAAAEEKPQPQE